MTNLVLSRMSHPRHGVGRQAFAGVERDLAQLGVEQLVRLLFGKQIGGRAGTGADEREQRRDPDKNGST